MPSFPFRTIPPTIIRGSGIGSSKYLAEAQVHRVGENYQDHNLVTIPYPASEDSDCIDSITNGDAELIKCDPLFFSICSPLQVCTLLYGSFCNRYSVPFPPLHNKVVHSLFWTKVVNSRGVRLERAE